MWLVGDMDRTLVDKPPQGGYPTIQDGPCFDAASRWRRTRQRGAKCRRNGMLRQRRQLAGTVPLLRSPGRRGDDGEAFATGAGPRHHVPAC